MRKYYLALLFFILIHFANAQNTFYFMEHMPQKQSFNPAFIPQMDFYLNLPGINGFSASAYNSGFFYDELDDFLDQLPHADYNPDEFVHSIGASNRFITEAKANIIGFGFRVNEKSFFSFNVASNHFAVLDAESDVAYLLTDFDDLDDSKFPLVVDGVDLTMNNYMKVGFTYTRKIGEHLTIGLNPHLNVSLAGVKSHNLSYVVDIESTDPNGYREYDETFTGEAALGLPFRVNPDAVSEGELDLDKGLFSDSWEEDLNFTDVFQNRNFSLNLGATYQVNRWNLSASLLNIGASGWKRNAYHLQGKEEVISISEKRIKIGIPPKLYLGAVRQFSPRWTYGLLIENAFYPGKPKAAATLSLNGAVGRMLSTSFSYTAGYGFDNFGCGLRLRFFPGMDLFFVTDNLVQAINYKKAYTLSGAVGINFSTGLKKYLHPTRRGGS